jgi:fatty-acyl-CoA synthase
MAREGGMSAAAGAAGTSPATVADLLLARAADDGPGLCQAGAGLPPWTWRQVVRECAARGAWLAALPPSAPPGHTPPASGRRPRHAGVLLGNIPEFVFLIGGAALAGQVVVALNATRSPAELAADAIATDCDILLYEPAMSALAHQAAGCLAGSMRRRIAVRDVTSPDYQREVAATGPGDLARGPAAAQALVMLIFTSGTTGGPRAVRVTNRKIVIPGLSLAGLAGTGVTPGAVYSPMPLFHSGAVMAAFAPALAAGACLVLRHRFSASALLPDVRAHGCTYLHYVGKALSYVLATPERPDDHDNPLAVAFGNEASPAAAARFSRRFGCRVIDGYGSTETAISLIADAATPAGSIGRLPGGVRILDPATGRECPPARLARPAAGAPGRLLNGEAIGELVNVTGAGLFDGYYQPESGRLRGTGRPGRRDSPGRAEPFYSGDLAYADADGFVYFAGRRAERIRVDGENISAAAVEDVLRQFPAVLEAAVYPVPDPLAGDQVMAALVLRGGAEFHPESFGMFLRRRADMGARQLPRFVRITPAFPQTATNKVLKRELVAQAWSGPEPVWFRPGRAPEYRLLTDRDTAGIRAEFCRAGRLHLLEQT